MGLVLVADFGALRGRGVRARAAASGGLPAPVFISGEQPLRTLTPALSPQLGRGSEFPHPGGDTAASRPSPGGRGGEHTEFPHPGGGPAASRPSPGGRGEELRTLTPALSPQPGRGGTAAGTETPLEALEAFVFWGRGLRNWKDGHCANVTRQLRFWVRVVPLNTWGDFCFLAARVEVIAGRCFRGMSVDDISTDSNETLRLKPATLKPYAGTLLAWVRWLANAKRRLIPLENLQDLEAVEWPRAESEKDDFRRPYSEDELKRLFWVCSPARKLLYWVAIETGYRLSELKRLTTSDFNAEERRLRLAGAKTKNGRKARGVLTAALCGQLAAVAAGLGPEAALLEVPAKGARTIYSDLRAAQIDYADHGDGRLDFHSLRASKASLSFLVGGTINEVQRGMRHASPDLTTHYAKDDEVRQREIGEKIVERLGLGKAEERMLWD